MQTSQEIDEQLIAILAGYKQRAALQLSLGSCDQSDYGKDSEQGKLLTSILTQMEAVELEILTGLAKLVGVIESMCKKQGIAPGKLDTIRLFKPHKAIEQVLSTRATPPKSFSEIVCQAYTATIQGPNNSKESGKTSRLVDARHLVQFGQDVYDVVAIIQSLVRMWSLVLESNLDFEKHPFVSQSRSVEVDMWVTGGFYEAVTKRLPPAIRNLQTKTASPELVVIMRDIQDRLKRIDIHYGERYDSRDALRKFCGHDTGKRTPAYERAILKMQIAEDNLLSELYHLGDNVKDYLKKCSQSDDFKIVESFEPYRWCGNYVNNLKHGSRGKNRPSAMPGYQFEIYDQKGPELTLEDRIVDVLFMINIDGQLESGMDIAHQLIDMWLLFLRFHSSIELSEITLRINNIRQKEFVGMSIYSAKIPDGVLDDAKKQAQERRKLNL